jgi:hypothetical protein
VFLDLLLMVIQSRLSRWRSPRTTEHGRAATFARRILSTGRAGGPV